MNITSVFVWQMFEGYNKRNLLLYSTWDQTSTDQLKNEQALFFISVDNLGFSKTVHPIIPDWSRLVDTGLKTTRPEQWKLAIWPSHDSATRAPCFKFWLRLMFSTQSNAVIHTPQMLCVLFCSFRFGTAGICLPSCPTHKAFFCPSS